MKKIMQRIGYLCVGMLLLLPSCTDTIVPVPEGPINQYDSDTTMVPITLDLSGIVPEAKTYGTNYPGVTDVPGTSAENAITDIYVYVFDNTYTCEKILHGATSPIGPEMVKVGMKHFIAVINGPSNIPSLPTTPAATSYTVLRKMLTNALATTLPSSPFLMVGEKLNFSVTPTPGTVSIDVERACAKITMNFTKSARAATKSITIKRIILHQGAKQIYLLDVPDAVPYTTYNLTGTKTTFSPNASVQNLPTYIHLADTFYTYASQCGSDKSKAVYFEIESEVGSPSNVRTAKFYLGEYEQSPGDTVYDIRRNYWYDVNVNMVDPGFDSLYVTVVSCPWNVAPSQDTAVGGGYEATTSLPFKLVKPYTDSELTAGNNGAFAAIRKHTKGQSYIDLKVTQGTGWSLDFKSGVAANTGAKMALGSDSANWTSDWKTTLSGTGDGAVHRIWIYRPYVENAEPKAGPSLTLKVGGVEVRDFVVQPRDTTPIPTNCYIMRPQLLGYPVNETRAYIPLAGVYKYWEDELMANGDSIPAGPVTANISWTDHSGTIVQNVSVLNAGKRDSAYIYAEAGPTQGNAVVDMKVGGVIYWSFHLWVTEYNPYEPAGEKAFNNGTINNVFMDRNLGALKNVYDAAGEARGMYYQFGRKDPFQRGEYWGNGFYGGAPTHSPAPTASTTLRPKAAIITMLKNPKTFYTGSWPFYTENNFLWKSEKGNKTAFDPCPEGYRIPVQTTTANNPWALTGLFEPVENNGRYAFDLGYYPLAGYINASGTLGNTGSHAYFWSSSASATGGSGLHISKTATDFYYNNTSEMPNNRGYSVRCVVDANYLLGGGKAFGTSAEDLHPTPIP